MCYSIRLFPISHDGGITNDKWLLFCLGHINPVFCQSASCQVYSSRTDRAIIVAVHTMNWFRLTMAILLGNDLLIPSIGLMNCEWCIQLTWSALTYVTRRLNCLKATPPSLEIICSCRNQRNLRCSILWFLDPDNKALRFHKDRSTFLAYRCMDRALVNYRFAMILRLLPIDLPLRESWT